MAEQKTKKLRSYLKMTMNKLDRDLYYNNTNQSPKPGLIRGPTIGAKSIRQSPKKKESKTNPEEEKEKVKIFALETIGSLLDVVNDKDEEQKILQSFFVHYKGLKREAAELG